MTQPTATPDTATQPAAGAHSAKRRWCSSHMGEVDAGAGRMLAVRGIRRFICDQCDARRAAHARARRG